MNSNSINIVEYWRDSKKIHKLLGLKGKIVSFTKISSSDKDGRNSSFFVVLAKLENKRSLMLEVVDESKDIKINDNVKIVLRRTVNSTKKKEDPIIYGLKFKK